MAKKLMVVESPNKVKKIAAVLGDEWEVMASASKARKVTSEAALASRMDAKPHCLTTKESPANGVPRMHKTGSNMVLFG